MISPLPQQHENTSIFQNAYKGDLSLIRTVITPQSVIHKDADGRTLLHWACSGSHKELVEFLLEYTQTHGHDILNVQDDAGWTPLIISASVGFFEITRLLLDKGADPSLLTTQRRSALHYASSKSHFEICELLVNRGCSISQQDQLGQTPLFRACIGGSLKIVNLFVEKGANVQHLDGNNDTSLHLAIENEKAEIAILLINHGADMKQKNKDGKTPMDMTLNQKVKDYIADQV